MPAAWNTCRAPLGECDRAAWGSMAAPELCLGVIPVQLLWILSLQAAALGLGAAAVGAAALSACSAAAALKSPCAFAVCPSGCRAVSAARIWVTEECCEQHGSKTTCLVTSCTSERAGSAL